MTVLKCLDGSVIAASETKTLRQLCKEHKVDLCGADLGRAYLAGADLHGADLAGADLHGADLRWANLRGANLAGADLAGAYLTKADLHGADLRWADLVDANLRGADLQGADLQGANLREANLCGIRVTDTVLDPDKSPNGIVDKFFERDGDYVIGYRTREAGHIDQYRDGRYYSADWFSVCPETECHPGLYLWPTLEEARGFSGYKPMIRVRTRPSDVHKAGGKWRCRWFEVLGPVEEREEGGAA